MAGVQGRARERQHPSRDRPPPHALAPPGHRVPPARRQHPPARRPDRRVWSHAALAFATVYTALISINYYVQLTWVAPRLAAGRTEAIGPFLFLPFDSFLYAVDILGYSFMSVATLLAANVFTGRGLPRTARLFLTANGLLLPFIALQMYLHSLIWIAALWAITFPGSTWTLALLFRRAETTPLNA